MITLHVLLTFLESFFQPTLFTDFGPNGLQIEGKKEIKKIACAVSASLETLQEAVKSGCDALIVHHGLFWNRDGHVIDGVKRKKIALILESGLSLIAYHLPMDAHNEVGNNWKAALDLGWRECSPCGGIGVRGVFDAIDVKAFQRQLEGYYEHPAAVAFGGKERVSSAALISGGAHKEIMAAVKAGVDCFITGSFDEPIWHIAHEEGINFFALGHAATERVGPKALAAYLKQKFSVDTCFLDLPNPF